ncbi:MAG: bifunctional nuclease family protein [Caldilineaceae bacterium]|nr:bifunctional nuclease family protein [Caldilineaceae bacterium]
MDQKTEVALVNAARTGDKDAFGALVERHLATARYLARHMVADAEIADELTQEAMLQAYLGVGRLRDPTRFAPWLYGIVRNVCRTWLRSPKLQLTTADRFAVGDYVASSLSEPLTLLEAQEQAALLQQALTALSPKNGMATWLFYYEGLRIDEIAIALDASPNAIKGRLYQSRKQLQHYLVRHLQLLSHTPLFMNLGTEREPTMTLMTELRLLKVEQTGRYVLYLLDTAGHRYLQMWVGAAEGAQIQHCVQGALPVPPSVYRSVAELLPALAITLEAVQITSLKNHLFLAVAQFRNGDRVQEVEARPSDAIALALHMQSPIRVDTQLLQDVGQVLPANFAVEPWLQNEAHHLQQALGWRDQIVQERDRTFTPSARLALLAASASATERHHNYIGTEHLLYGLMADQASLVAHLLQEQHVQLTQIDAAMDRLVGRGDTPTGEEPMIVPRVATVLSLAVTASQQGGQRAIGPEHLLLGLLQEGKGMGMTILRELGVDPAQLQAWLMSRMASSI